MATIVRWSPLLAILLAVAAFAQQEPLAVPDPPVWVTPGKIPSKQIFAQYCASCHGLSAKGDGPVASSLKRQPTDLTTLTKQNKGKFPEMAVIQAIKAGPLTPAHGTPLMPLWGPIFLTEGKAATLSEVQLLIYNLTDYLKSLQVK